LACFVRGVTASVIRLANAFAAACTIGSCTIGGRRVVQLRPLTDADIQT
jgi:hypothetical protein